MENTRPADPTFWNSIGQLEMTSEAQVEQRLIQPLLAALGYANEEIAPKAPITFQEGRKGRKHEADFIVHYGSEHNQNSSLIVVEAKAPAQSLEDARLQAESYAQASRAPFLLLSDGKSLEIWQMQSTQNSVQAISCQVHDLLRNRGTIERLIGRQAAIAHCRSLNYKPLNVVANDVGNYVGNELNNVSPHGGIARRVLYGSTAVDAVDALTQLDNGAIILAPSGFGKSTLASDLHRHWLATQSETGPISILIPLADLAELDQAPQDYAKDRLAARCPQFGSTAAFADLIESRGIRLICDGLDRISSEAQRKFLTKARALQRDRPKISLFILGRASARNDLGLPTLELLPLDRSEREALAALVCPSRGAMAIHAVPDILEPLAGHPLLLTLYLQHSNRVGAAPTQLDDLFETWLSQLLEADGHGPAAVSKMRTTLSKFAIALARSGKSLAQLRDEVPDSSDETLDALVRSGALKLSNRVELLHDALGDYLRAEAMAILPSKDFEAQLANETFFSGSLFPMLLMSQCLDRQKRRALWDRLLTSGLDVYLDVLRFGGEPESTGRDPDSNAAYLEEFRDGIILPTQRFMAPIKRNLYTALTWTPTEQLGIRGHLSADGSWFTYEFFDAAVTTSSIAVEPPTSQKSMGGFNLDRNVGGKNARRMGFDKLRDALAHAIMNRQIVGGPTWVNERLAGRLRFAVKKWGLASQPYVNFSALRTLLSSHHDETIYINGFGDRRFKVNDLLDDIAILRGFRSSSVDLWWEAYGGDQATKDMDTTRLDPLMNEYWRRTQIVYRELVEHSFPEIAGSLNFFSAMPVRYQVRVHEVPNWGRGTEFLWWPVSEWAQAGADVKFGWEGLYSNETYAKTAAELARLGRTGCKSVAYVQSSLPHFDGTHRNHSFDGETAVLRNALALLVDDFDRLFARLGVGGSLKSKCIVGA